MENCNRSLMLASAQGPFKWSPVIDPCVWFHWNRWGTFTL